LKKFLVLFLSLVFIFLSSCSYSRNDDRIKVCVTLYPIYDFTKKICGDKINIVDVTPSGDVHNYEPSFKVVDEILSSDYLIYNGVGLERWVEDIISANEINAVAVSDGVNFLDTDGNIVNKNSHAVDPHIWLSPVNAKIIAINIRDSIVSLDVKNEDYYNASLERLISMLDALHNSYALELSDLRVNTIITCHSAYTYLCKEYGLKQISALDANSHGDESLQRRENIIDKINIKEPIKIFIVFKNTTSLSSFLILLLYLIII